MLLNFEHVSKSYGDRQLLDDVTFYLSAGDRLGVVGVNGCGKSTLLKLAAKAESPDYGAVTYDPNVRVAYLSQELHDNPEYTILQQVLFGQPEDAREVAEYEAVEMLNKLGIPDIQQKIETLSGGQRKRVALVQTLLSPADLLILDEPTNHLDFEMIRWLENFLGGFRGAILMVTHDRYFLENVASQTAEVSFGRFFTYDGGYSAYLDGKAQREEMEAASERKRQSILRKELAWVLQGPCARGTKSRERLERYKALRDRQPPQVQEEMQDIRMISSRLGRKTIELSGVSKSYDGKQIFSPFDFLLQRDDRVGILGLNGSGKTTLLNLIAGKIQPDSGSVSYGETVRIGYFSQHSEELDNSMTALAYVKEKGESIETADGVLSAAKLMELFLFPGVIQHRPIGKLSGGEKRRLFLLGVLASAPNVLLLDEPTNDLDIPTLQILENYLETFPGAIITVSHDRYFLDRICRRVFALESGHPIRQIIGGYSDYMEQVITSEKESVSPAPTVTVKREKPKNQRLRFSFKEQREFETIDDDIAALEQKIRDIQKEEEANATDYVRLQELMAQREALEQELEEKTDRWVYLNELAEKISAQNPLCP